MKEILQRLQVYLKAVPRIGLVIVVSLLIFFCTGCDMEKRRQALEEKEASLNQKEQELLLRESSLKMKEVDLENMQKLLDSASNTLDTLSALHPGIPGIWNVTMRCIETTCTGSAVGDVKNEQWDISFQNNKMIAKAMSDNKLLRIYSGTYVADSYELTAQQESTAPGEAAKMVVRLQHSKENEMTGQREIIRADCRIVYALILKKT